MQAKYSKEKGNLHARAQVFDRRDIIAWETKRLLVNVFSGVAVILALISITLF